jgi:hypothetical protein
MSDKFVIVGDDVYLKPRFIHFSSQHHESIFDAQTELHERLHRVARLISEPLNFSIAQRNTHALPEVVAGMLSRTDQGAAIAACVAFLESKGYSIVKGGDHQ